MDIQKVEIKREWMLPAVQNRSRQQRDRLLKAGERVFATRGFSDAHVADIVSEANCSVGSFYRRFKDKEALFLALQQEMSDQARGHIDKFFSNPACDTKPLTAVFHRLIENTGIEARRIKGFYRALFEMSLRGRNVWQPMRALESYQAERLQRLLVGRRGQEFAS